MIFHGSLTVLKTALTQRNPCLFVFGLIVWLCGTRGITQNLLQVLCFFFVIVEFKDCQVLWPFFVILECSLWYWPLWSRKNIFRIFWCSVFILDRHLLLSKRGLAFYQGEKVKGDQHQSDRHQGMEKGSCINCLDEWFSIVHRQFWKWSALDLITFLVECTYSKRKKIKTVETEL